MVRGNYHIFIFLHQKDLLRSYLSEDDSMERAVGRTDSSVPDGIGTSACTGAACGTGFACGTLGLGGADFT